MTTDERDTQAAKLDMAEGGNATVAEAAAFIGCGVRSIYTLVERGELASFRHPAFRGRRIPRKALVAFVASGIQAGSPDESQTDS
jgi:excisionase family DNA binding protein